MPITDDDLRHWFTYHPPAAAQQEQFVAIREAALRFAQVVANNTPPSADQTVAIRTIREAVFWANAAIACEGR